MKYDPAWSATTPMQHQLLALDAALPRPAFGLFMEQGTGKTKVALDKAVAHFRHGEIDGILVVAPNGVHRNWTQVECPKHLPSMLDVRLAAWRSGMGKKATAEFNQIFEQRAGVMRILAMNVEALSLKGGEEIAKRFLTSGRMMMVVDESNSIKNMKARRTKAAMRLGRIAMLRLIATGTPIGERPLDLYAQLTFLKPGYLGDTYTAFKNRYAEWRDRRLATGVMFKELVRYVRLDELKARMAGISFQVQKRECLDLPDKVYVQRFVELGDEQSRLYRAVIQELIAEIRTNVMITTTHTLTRLVRAQQILGGFAQADNEKVITPIANAKLTALVEMIEDWGERTKAIIYARFVPELRAIADRLDAEFGPGACAKYWGEIDEEARAINEQRFHNDPRCRFFVANQTVGGRGLTLNEATQVIYYSNTFSLIDRLQSEDRPHRIGQTNKVTYTDLLVEGTLDMKIARSHAEKTAMAELFKTPLDLLGEENDNAKLQRVAVQDALRMFGA